jgi:hypothetical protein
MLICMVIACSTNAISVALRTPATGVALTIGTFR